MTSISERKTIVRAKTSAHYRGRALVIELRTHEVFIRESGRRTGYSVPWLAVFDLGAKIQAREDRAAKLEAKKNRRAMP